MSTTPRVYTIIDRRRALNLYTGGKSLRQVAAEMRMPKITVRDWCADAGILRTRGEGIQILHTGDVWLTPENVERARAMLAAGAGWADVGAAFGIPKERARVSLYLLGLRVASSGRVAARSWYDPTNRAAAARLARIADAVRLRSEGRMYTDLARHFGVHPQTVFKWAATSYGRALREFVYGPGKASRKAYAVAMREEMHLPAWFIAKVLDATPAMVDRWLATKEPQPRLTSLRPATRMFDGGACHRAEHVRPDGTTERYESSRGCVACTIERNQTRTVRARAVRDAHRDADTRPQPE
jgi:hypothetical protein